MPCTQAQQRLRQMQGLLGSGGQSGELPPEMGFRRVQPGWTVANDEKGER